MPGSKLLPADAPLGVFDSGVGGLSVLREIRRKLPHEDLLYVADSAHVPYGAKSPEFIRGRCFALADFLLGKGAKALVIACNTATAAGAEALRASFPRVPVIGMEPAVKPAVAATKSGVIGVLATVGTVTSARYAALLGQFAAGVNVVTQGAPGLPEAVERGELDSRETERLAMAHLAPLLRANADVIVLGCTHYPFLRPLLQRLVGPGVTLIDTGAAVASQTLRRLKEASLLASRQEPGTERFWTSGETARLRGVISQLWGRDVIVDGMAPEETAIE